MTLSDLVKAYRAKNELSQRQFAALCGLSNGYISMIEKNENPKTRQPLTPSIPALNKIATVLGYTLDELLALADDMPVVVTDTPVPLPANILPMPKMKRVPLIGTIACGTPILAVEDATEFINAPEGLSDIDFALECKGDSMINARIFPGDIVYIKQQPVVENGEIAAVLIGDEATLKRVYYTPGNDRITLQACNPLYSDMIYTGPELNDIKILGKAVWFMSKVRI